MWMETGGVNRATLPPRRQQGGFGTEVYAIYQAIRLFESRNEGNADHTTPSDPAAAISRVHAGPGQAFSRAIIEVNARMLSYVATDAGL